jgi:tryptophanyl-tRNA synthetase
MQKIPFYIVLFFLVLGINAPAYAQQNHPAIRHAIATLEQTKTDLENGEHGFGGHRSAALEHIDAALKELQQALEYADAHPGEVRSPAHP